MLIGTRVNVQEVICGWQFVVFDQFAADCDGAVQHEVLGILNNRLRHTNTYIYSSLLLQGERQTQDDSK